MSGFYKYFCRCALNVCNRHICYSPGIQEQIKYGLSVTCKWMMTRHLHDTQCLLVPSLLLTQMHFTFHTFRTPILFLWNKVWKYWFKSNQDPLQIFSCQSFNRNTLNISGSGKVNVTGSIIFLKEEKFSRCIILLLLTEWICNVV